MRYYQADYRYTEAQAEDAKFDVGLVARKEVETLVRVAILRDASVAITDSGSESEPGIVRVLARSPDWRSIAEGMALRMRAVADELIRVPTTDLSTLERCRGLLLDGVTALDSVREQFPRPAAEGKP